MGIQYQGSAGAVFGPAGANHSQGMVTDPGSNADSSTTHRFLRSDATWDQVDYASVTGTPAPGQLPGTATNDNAAAGDVGEYVTSGQVSGVGLSNNTPTNITSISLTAGDWEVSGNAGIVTGAASAVTLFEACASLNGTAITPIETGATLLFNISIGASATNRFAIPPQRASLSTTTSVFLNVEATITSGSATGNGVLRARRVR